MNRAAQAVAALLALHLLSMSLGQLCLAGGRVADLDLAGRVDPFSIEVRQAQMESLFLLSEKGAKSYYLEEALAIARETRRFYPGNAQAWMMEAVAWTLLNTHPVTLGEPPLNGNLAMYEAMRLDPISPAPVEQVMFFLSARRSGLEKFRELGVRRARLVAGAGLKMKCALCRKHWLAHAPASKSESGRRATSPETKSAP